MRGPFHFQPGDDSRWSDPAFDDSGWQLIAGDRNWKAAGLRDLHGLAWYRFTVLLPPGSGDYSIRLPQIRTAYQLYLNGQLLHSGGNMPPHANMYATVPEVIALPVQGPATLHFALRVWQDPVWCAYRPGGLQGPVLIGQTSLIQERFLADRLARLWRNSDWFDLTALELFAAAVAFLLYLLGRSEREYLWFCTLALGLSLNHALQLWARLNAHSVHPAELLESICYTAYLAASLLFYRMLLGAKATRTFHAMLVCCALWFINARIPMLSNRLASVENIGELLFTLPIDLWLLSLIFRRARQRSPDARLLALPATLLVGTAFYYQLLFTLSTFRPVDFKRFYPILHGPVYADMKDFAEAFFLLAMLLILGNRFARTRRNSDRTAAELEAARSVQRVLVPEQMPEIEGLEIVSAYYPAQQVGGDFFQIIPLPAGDTLIVIGDVAGKGLPAALTVSLIVGTLRTLAEFIDGPGNILAGLNRRLVGRAAVPTTCLAMQFSADCQNVRIANAGHLPAYLNRNELATETNLPLGLCPEVFFEESTFALQQGEHIVILTDGVPEAMQRKELFGFDRTRDLCAETATVIADTARAFGQTDDITVLSIHVLCRSVDPGPLLEPTKSSIVLESRTHSIRSA